MRIEGTVAVLFVMLAVIGVAATFVYPPAKAAAQPPLKNDEMRAKPLECFVPIEIITVHDGDTLRADVMLPWGVTLRNRTVRLLGVDCWEVARNRRTVGEITDEELAKGRAARDALDTMLASCIYIYLKPPPEHDEHDPYGRLHGELFAVDRKGLKIDVARWLRDHGHARSM